MEQEKGKKKRWKKFTAFVISAVMSISFIPGTAYAVDESGNVELRSEIVSVWDGVVHIHNWSYTKTRFTTNDQEVTASCQNTIRPCTVSGDVHLTMKVEKDQEGRNKVSVLAEGEELMSSNDLGIKYTIKYLDRYGSEIQGTQPPRADGTYKVRARFGSESNGPYLEADYIVKHEHRWVYEKGWDAAGNQKITATCQNAQDTICPASGSIDLTLKVTRGSGDKSIVSVLANGTKITNDNRWNIGYEIKYYDRNGNEIGTEPPKETGIYKVRAVFDGGTYLEADYEVVHTHRWEYKTTPDNDQQVIAVCKNTTESTCPLYGNTLLTVRAAKDPSGQIRAQVQANGEELTDNNSLGIRYTIRYFRIRADKTEESLTSAPQADGIYRARTTFGSASRPYLDIRYRITQGEINDHKHIWTYAVEDPGTVSGNAQAVSVSCQGSGTCVEGADGIRFVLDVQGESDYTEEPQSSRVTLTFVDRNGHPLDLDLEDLGIRYQIAYYEDVNGNPGHTALEQEPQDAGAYHVRVSFGDGDSAVLEDTFTIDRVVQESYMDVGMDDYVYGASQTSGPTLIGATGTETIEYYYYEWGEEELVKIQKGSEEFDPKSLSAGDYEVLARYTQESDGNHIYETDRSGFRVEKAERSGLTVTMKSYDLKGKRPAPQLKGGVTENAGVTFYTMQNSWSQDVKWGSRKLGAGTYHIYAVVAATTNYEAYTTPLQKFTVYADHRWAGMPGSLASREQKKTVQCSCCGKKQTIVLPKKTMSITMGRSAKLVSKNTGCTFAVKVRNKCLKVSAKGTLTTKAAPSYYSSMKTSVPVAVKIVGKTYQMNVKLKIPAPKVTVKSMRVRVGNVPGYQFRFYYNIPGAKKIRVTMDRGETSAIRSYLDRYVSDPRPKAAPLINLSDSSLRKINNRVTFRITAYYGKNRSEVLSKTVSVR